MGVLNKKGFKNHAVDMSYIRHVIVETANLFECPTLNGRN